MNKLSWVLVASSLLLLVGCGKSRESQLLGDWVATVGGQTLTLKEDHKFTLGMPSGQNMDGTWKLSESTVHLDPATVNGKSVADLMKQADAAEKANPSIKTLIEQSKKQLDNLDMKLDDDNKKMSITTTMGKDSTTITFEKKDTK